MKELATQPKPDFDSYVIRPDIRFGEREHDDVLEDIYASGYSPYSGTKELYNIFYNARNARVVLQEFALTSENRRIARKFDGQFDSQRIPINEFIVDGAFYTFVLEYFAQRLGPGVMPRERLDLLFTTGLITTVVKYHQGSKIIGYVFEVGSGSMRHYWYSAYDVSLAQQSLGLWLMLDCIRNAKAAGLSYYYLGTVYGEKALYKTNFEPLEWWDGSSWNTDIPKLKELGRSWEQ
jgi:hypothetical protein